MIAQLAVQPEVVAKRAPVVVPTLPDYQSVSSLPTPNESKNQVSKSLPRRSSRLAASQKPITVVSASIGEAIRRLNIKETEGRQLQTIYSLKDLQTFVNAEDQRHQQRVGSTSGGKFQSALVKIDDFAKAYEPILSAFKEAIPNGGGHAVWALLGGFFLIAQRKDRREKAITEFLSRLQYSLPRNDRYRALYQSSTTIAGLHERLHIVIIDALLQACEYFRDRKWTGTLARISAAMSVHDVMAECFDEVANISAEIDSESMLELRNEVREAHNETSQIKKEAETTNMYLTEMKEQLSLASDQLTLVNGQLEHTKQLNANLQKKLDEIFAQSLSDLATKLKSTLVPPTYAASNVLSSCRQQIRCPNRRAQQLRQLSMSSEWQQWEVSKKIPSTSLIWITDKRHATSSVSVASLKAIDDLAESHLVLHSLYQTGAIVSSLPQNARTAITILGEALYQLLCSCPNIWHKYKPIPNQDCGTSLNTLMEQFTSLLNAWCDSSPNSNDERKKVYWLVDRIDTVFWRTDNSSLRLSEGPPQASSLSNAERKQVARASTTLEDFLDHLNSMSPRSDRADRERKEGYARKWELKVLVSSHYEVSALRSTHGSDEEAIWGPGKWIDLVVR